MADWGLATISSDLSYLRQQIVAQYSAKKIVIGGLSMGSIASMAALNANLNDFADHADERRSAFIHENPRLKTTAFS
jgi:hypothetical protein